MKVGVFDSGVGGLSVAKAIERAFAHLEVTFVNDTHNVPYGTKTSEELYDLVLPILQELAQKSDIIVIACNTVTTTLIEKLRLILPVPLIGVEPMVKPAAARTEAGIIAVCATPTTLASTRYDWLKQTYAKDITVLEPECSDWSYMIEHNQLDREKITARIEEVLQKGADIIVLGCTHYHWIEKEIAAIAGKRALVLQPEQAVIRQLQRFMIAPSLAA